MGGEEDDGGGVEVVAAEAFEDVDAFLVRHREGVKKEEGVVVEEGGFAARGVNLDAETL